MSKINKKDEINKILPLLMKRISAEDDRFKNMSIQDILTKINDYSLNGKYSLWVLREYLKGNIKRFEDMGRVKQSLILFKNNSKKFLGKDSNILSQTFFELENLVAPFLEEKNAQINNKEKILQETKIIRDDDDHLVLIPKTKESAQFWGKGTKWCTSSLKNNMFEYYNGIGNLYIVIHKNQFDTQGRQVKYQLHTQTEQFMNSNDIDVSFSETGMNANDFLSYDFVSYICNNDGVFFIKSKEKHGEKYADFFAEVLSKNKKTMLSYFLQMDIGFIEKSRANHSITEKVLENFEKKFGFEFFEISKFGMLNNLKDFSEKPFCFKSKIPGYEEYKKIMPLFSKGKKELEKINHIEYELFLKFVGKHNFLKETNEKNIDKIKQIIEILSIKYPYITYNFVRMCNFGLEEYLAHINYDTNKETKKIMSLTQKMLPDSKEYLEIHKEINIKINNVGNLIKEKSNTNLNIIKDFLKESLSKEIIESTIQLMKTHFIEEYRDIVLEFSDEDTKINFLRNYQDKDFVEQYITQNPKYVFIDDVYLERIENHENEPKSKP